MSTKYKIIIACLITCVATAFATVYVMNHDIFGLYTSKELICKDGVNPDEHGCCPGELYTNLWDQGPACCPTTGGDCFPPLEK